ncbi:hypothetical protein [Methylobacterium sp. 1030]|uniref:hypothetical protein n=1 Tax=Methylobacterium sp. 1030 TaxID=3156404 RepID=UPI00339A7143
MSTPAIMKMVSEKRAALVAQRRAVELLEAELSGMEAILAMIPQTPLSSGKGSETEDRAIGVVVSRSGGRQPGAISNKWKRHLLALDENKAAFNLEDIIELVAEREGRNMRPSEVKRIFDKYVDQGHVTEADDMYMVPDSTIHKFKAALREAGADLSDEDDSVIGPVSKNDSEDKQQPTSGYDVDDDIPFEAPASKRGGYDLDDDIPF